MSTRVRCLGAALLAAMSQASIPTEASAVEAWTETAGVVSVSTMVTTGIVRVETDLTTSPFACSKPAEFWWHTSFAQGHREMLAMVLTAKATGKRIAFWGADTNAGGGGTLCLDGATLALGVKLQDAPPAP
ncbi:MAG: hypothetical protein H6983_11900 [Ectothiorhodospiraceae bacterium]|nr:hypothetical protein [Chromatiales bacterium]MCP5154863.1 hypothetical protein [Ectothiorhodospiraceae bacterium]